VPKGGSEWGFRGMRRLMGENNRAVFFSDLEVACGRSTSAEKKGNQHEGLEERGIVSLRIKKRGKGAER